jgi:hypothetical protein
LESHHQDREWKSARQQYQSETIINQFYQPTGKHQPHLLAVEDVDP